VVLHNVWVWDWRVTITILGWLTLIKGILKIGFSEFIHKQAHHFKAHQIIEAIMLLALGGWLFLDEFLNLPFSHNLKFPVARCSLIAILNSRMGRELI